MLEQVKQLQGVIAQQSARLQQLEETHKLPAAQVPQDPLALALPGRPPITSAGETANGALLQSGRLWYSFHFMSQLQPFSPCSRAGVLYEHMLPRECMR